MDENVHTTCVEMLQQRGYEITKDDEEMFIGKKGSSSIVVFYNTNPKFNVERLQEYISLMEDMSIHHAIVVYKDSVTPVAKKVISELQGMVVELFEEKSLRYNITKHRLVPKHILLSKSECVAFKQKYGLKIPVILTTDPVCRFYNFQRGDIVKIHRLDDYVSFRIVK